MVYFMSEVAPDVLNRDVKQYGGSVRNLLQGNDWLREKNFEIGEESEKAVFDEMVQNIFVQECSVVCRQIRSRFLYMHEHQKTVLRKDRCIGKLEDISRQRERTAAVLREKDQQLVKLERQLFKQSKLLASLQDELKLKNKLLDDIKTEYRYMKECINSENNDMELPATVEYLDTKTVAALRVAVIGGRDDWQNRLKQKYPDFIFIGVKEVNYDVNVLDKADVIVFNWTYVGHSVYSKQKDYLGKFSKPLVYTRGNEEILLRELARYV